MRRQQAQAASRLVEDGGGSAGGSPTKRSSPKRSSPVRTASPSRQVQAPAKPPRKTLTKPRPPRPPLPTAPPVDEETSLRLDSLSHEASTPFFVYALTFFSAMGGFLFGYDTGVISGAMILLRDYFRLNSVWQELVVAVTVGAAAIFALIGGFLNDRIGRRPVIIIASLVFTIGSLTLGLATDRYLLLIGRIVVGAGIGLTSTTIPMYIAESAPTAIRGRLVSTNVVMIAFGQFVANVVDGGFSYRKEDGWRYMLGLGAVPACIQFVGFIFMPESPRWLITKGDEDQARMVLQRIRGDEDIEDEFYKIRHSCEEAEMENEARSHTPIIWQMLTTPAVRRSLIIGCSLQMFQQLAGINTVMYYSATIIKMSGVKSEESAIWLSAVTAAVNFIFTFVGVYLVEKIGRRPLAITSLLGAVVSLAWLGLGFQLGAMNSPEVTVHDFGNEASHCNAYKSCNECMMDLYCGYCYLDSDQGPYNASCLQSDYNDPMAATTGRCSMNGTTGGGPSSGGALYWAYDYCPTPFAFMPMMGLVLYLLFFAPGMGPMPWTINSEIYPLWARSTGNSVATFTNWMFNLAVSMSFLSLTETLTRSGTFWLYAVLALLGVVWLGFFLPETKGKSLEEVEGLFARPWCGTQGQPIPYSEKSVQYVHIRGLNRDGRESELESPE